MTDARSQLRDWLFRGLMFEAEAEEFRQAGIRVGANQQIIENSLTEEVLAPFGIAMRNDAMKMARLHALLYCFENSVRDLIRERLAERHGDNWWEKAVPSKVKTAATDRYNKAVVNSWLEGQRRDNLSFADFGHLSDIIISCWEDFSDIVPSQHWLKQRMDELEAARNYIAHNRLLLPSEFARIEMYVADWNRVVGL